ncbi:MAG: c-type cytochrome [Parvibaculales bacterium]
MKNPGKINFAILFVATFVCLTSLPSVAGEIVQARKQRFKQSGAALQLMSKQLAPAEDFEALKLKANELIEWANEMPGYFPPGSDTPDDEAKPNVFTDPEGFQSAAQNFANAAQMIEDAAKNGDIAAVKAAIGRTGASCKACHKKYRAKK